MQGTIFNNKSRYSSPSTTSIFHLCVYTECSDCGYGSEEEEGVYDLGEVSGHYFELV